MKKICLILTILLLVSCTKLSEKVDISETAPNNEITDEIAEKRYRDLETVWTSMNINYRYGDKARSPKISRNELEVYKKELKNRIPSMKSDMEFFCELQTLVAKLGDGHATMSLSHSDMQVYYLPIEVKKVENRWIITGTYKGFEKYLGYEIIEINNISMEDVYNRFSNFISFENEYWLEHMMESYLFVFDYLKYLKIVSQDADNVDLCIMNVQTEEIETLNIKAILNLNFISDEFKYIHSLEERRVKMYDAKELKPDTYLIELNACKISENYSITEFENKVFSDIEKNKYNKIIIDLRKNEGGNSSVFEYLIKLLKELQILYNFDVYTLIGKATFSSGVATAEYINNNLITTFYGTPTGGKPNSFGSARYVSLESPFEFYATLLYYTFVPYDDMMTIYPDITAEQTYNDFMNGIDTVIEEVILRE